jgi:hypothetical protein
MQTSVGQVNATNSAKSEIKNNENKQKPESAPSTHAGVRYEFFRDPVPSYELAFPFVHLRVLRGSPYLPAKQKWRKPKAAPFLYL